MYLYVEFINSYVAWHNVQMGLPIGGVRRVKKIKLTEEQIKQLQPKQVGSSGGVPMFEDVSVISIQDEQK